MKLEQFAMERMQSTYENQVEFNLSESGVHPLRLRDLVDDDESREALLAEALRYTQSNGTMALREQIAALYPGATPDHIQVTNGGSEANYITTWNLVEPGDEVVMMVPTAPLANLKLPVTWSGVFTLIFSPYFGLLVIVRSPIRMSLTPVTWLIGPSSVVSAVM
jgi:hypothetical protein